MLPSCASRVLLLSSFCAFTNQGQVRVEKALVQTQRNDFEPDVSVWLKERADNFTPDMKYYPAPDLVVEVLSNSTEGRDRGIKYDDYLSEGVAEYWIVDYRNQRRGAVPARLPATATKNCTVKRCWNRRIAWNPGCSLASRFQ